MANFGFDIILCEKLSFKEQVETFGSASHLVGVHGAGLTNMMFMQEGSKILEIRRADDVLNFCYYFMATSAKLDYYYNLAAGAGKSNVVQEDDLVVDILKLADCLTSMLGAK